MGYRWSEIANQEFQAGSDYLKSVANSARKAVCRSGDLVGNFLEFNELAPPAVAALLGELGRSLCELPEDPVLLPPANRAPSNEGKCQCQPYRVNYEILLDGAPFDSGFLDRRGAIGVFREERPNPGQPRPAIALGITHFGNINESCSLAPIKNDLVIYPGSGNIQLVLTGLSTPPGSTFVPCERPTLPTDRPRTPLPAPRPTIDIPRPTLPPITIPIFPVPLPVLPNVKFEPKLVIDVGGINIEFTVGEVNFNFNPELNAPITIFPPGYGQPSLPPAVRPDPSPSGEDCCDEILAAIAEVDVQVRETDLRVQGVQDTANGIKQTQDNVVVPLLEDIKDCSCPPETVQVATFTNLQGYTYQDANTKLAFAQVNVLTTDIKKTWTVDGGKEVALVGWYAFGRTGRLGERRALQFRNNLCLPEQPGMDEFTFGLYNGITANGTVHAEKTTED